MSTKLNASGGSGDQSGGQVTDPSQGDSNTSGGSDPKPQAPSYESYQKVLDEKKKIQERLKEFERKEKEAQEQKLKEQGDFKAMLEAREKDLAEKDQELNELRSTVNSAMKLSALRSQLNGHLDSQFVKLVDLDKIPIDPESGRPDDASVIKYAREFEAQYGVVLKKVTGNKLPHDAAKGSTGKLSIDEWKNLPLKEKKARLKDVIQN